MNKRFKRGITTGIALILAFILWTILIQVIDVQPVGVNGTNIGFATVNTWFHRLTGEHMGIYTITDWLGLVPIAVCLCFGALGLVQWIRRKSLLKVDPDILLLGGYYVVVILAYLLFEVVHINYRPLLIDGAMEGSYPSSTTLLVLSVMPTLVFQMNRRVKNDAVRLVASIVVVLFSAFMVIGRLVSGVHWLTDIIGGILLSAGLYLVYRATALLLERRARRRRRKARRQ